MSNSNTWRSGGMRSPRIECNGMSDFTVDGRLYTGVVKNRSTTGAFVEAAGNFQIGQSVVLTFLCPQDNKPIKRKGAIVRTTDTGFAIEYHF